MEGPEAGGGGAGAGGGAGGMGVVQYIRLLLDDATARKTEQDAARVGDRIAQQVSRGGAAAGQGMRAEVSRALAGMATDAQRPASAIAATIGGALKSTGGDARLASQQLLRAYDGAADRAGAAVRGNISRGLAGAGEAARVAARATADPLVRAGDVIRTGLAAGVQRGLAGGEPAAAMAGARIAAALSPPVVAAAGGMASTLTASLGGAAGASAGIITGTLGAAGATAGAGLSASMAAGLAGGASAAAPAATTVVGSLGGAGGAAGASLAQGIGAGITQGASQSGPAARKVVDDFDKASRDIGQNWLSWGRGDVPGLSALDRATERTTAAVGTRFQRLTQGIGRHFSDMAKGVALNFAAFFALSGLQAAAELLFKLGTDAEETGSKFGATFGRMDVDVQRFLDGFANKAGLATQAGQELSATAGSIVQGMGASQRESARFSQQMLTLAGDLQSFHNVPIQDTFAAIKSGLVGAWEPMDRLGIVLRQVDVDARAMADTGKKTATELTALEKASAALALMLERAGPATGNLDATQNSLQNTTRRLRAEFTDWVTGIAQRALPTLASLAHWVDQNKVALGFIGNLVVKVVAAGFTILGRTLGTVADIATGVFGFALYGVTKGLEGFVEAQLLANRALLAWAELTGDTARVARIREENAALEARAKRLHDFAEAAGAAAAAADQRLQTRMANGGALPDTGGAAPVDPAVAAGRAKDPNARGAKSKQQLEAEANARREAAEKAEAAEKKAQAALDQRITTLGRAMVLDRTRAAATAELQRLEAATLKQLGARNLTLDQTITLSERLATIQTALGTIPMDNRPLAERVQLLTQAASLEARAGTTGGTAGWDVRLDIRQDALAGLNKLEADIQKRLAKPLALPVRLELEGQLDAVRQARRAALEQLQAQQAALEEALTRVDLSLPVRVQLRGSLDAITRQVEAAIPPQVLALDTKPAAERLAALQDMARVPLLRDDALAGLRRMDAQLRRLREEAGRTITPALDARALEAGLRAAQAALDGAGLSLPPVPVTIPADQALADARATLERAALAVPPVVVDADARPALERVRADLSAAGFRLPPIPVDLDDRGAQMALAALRDALRAAGAALPTITPRVDLAALQDGLRAAEGTLASAGLTLPPIPLDIPAAGAVDQARADLAAAALSVPPVAVDADAAPALERVRGQLAAAGFRLAPIPVNLDAREAQAQLQALRDALAAATAQLPVIRPEADTRAAVAALDDLRRRVRQAQVDTLPTAQRVDVLTAQVDFTATRDEALAGLKRLEAELQAELDANALTPTLTPQAETEKRGQLRRVQQAQGTEPLDSQPLDDRLALLERATRVDALRGEALARLAQEEAALQAQVDAGNGTLAQRLKLQEQLRAVQDVRGTRPVASLPVDDQIRVYQDGLRFVDRRVESARGLLALEARITEQLKDQTLTVLQRQQLEGQRADVQESLDAGGTRALPAAAGAIQTAVTEPLGRAVGVVAGAFDEAPIPGAQWVADLLTALQTQLPDAATNAAGFLVATMSDAFDQLLDGVDLLDIKFGSIGKGMARSVLGEIGKMAKGKAMENVAWAAEDAANALKDLAVGNFPGAALHGKAAIGHALAAAKWGAVGAGVGGLAGGGGGGNAAPPAPLGRDGGDAVDNRATPSKVLFIKGGLLNTDDYEQMDALAAGLKQLGVEGNVVVRRG
jgi:hypothetical protein